MKQSELDSKLDIIKEAYAAGKASDDVSIYIGLSLIILGIINGVKEVPDAFIVGASLSGFFFTLADVTFLSRTVNRLNIFFAPLGIFCLFLLPILLLVFPDFALFKMFEFISDMGTFYAIGLVLIALGYKSRESKAEFISTTKEVLGYFQAENKEHGNAIASIEKERRELAERNLNLERKIDRLEADAEEFRVIVEKYKPKNQRPSKRGLSRKKQRI